MRPNRPLRLPLLLAVLAVAAPSWAQTEKALYKLGLVMGDSKNRADEGDVLNAVTDAFVTSRRFDVIERRQLNAVFTEKNLQEFLGGQINNKLTDVLGLDLLGVVGYTVETKYQPEKGSVTIWIIDVRLVDVKTAKVLSTVTSRGEPGSFSFAPPATPREAGDLLFASIRRAFPPLGYVIRVDGNTVIVDLGSDAGIQPRDVLEIILEGEQIIHPVTGEVLPAPMRVVGQLRVISVEPKIATCKRTSNKVEVRPASLVRLKGKRPMPGIDLIRMLDGLNKVFASK